MCSFSAFEVTNVWCYTNSIMIIPTKSEDYAIILFIYLFVCGITQKHLWTDWDEISEYVHIGS